MMYDHRVAKISNSWTEQQSHHGVIYNIALKPLSDDRSSPKKSAAWPRWSMPQKPSVSPFELVHSNQGSPNAPDLKARSVFEDTSDFTSSWFACDYERGSSVLWRRHTAAKISCALSFPSRFSRTGINPSGCPIFAFPSTHMER